MRMKKIGIVAFMVFVSLSALKGTPSAMGEETKIKDVDIRQAIEAELFLDQTISAHLIDVSVKNGIVTLSGTLDNLLARDRALALVESIKGVGAVINRINILPVIRSDSAIEKDIKNALVEDKVTEAYEIDVTVANKEAILSGTVDSWVERKVAETIAKGIVGVKEIQNNIIVQYDHARLDSEIKKDITRRFEIDPYIPEKLISIAVKNGQVTLSGTVGSAAEKTYAYNSAWVHGVKNVTADSLMVDELFHNNLKRTKTPLKTDMEIAEAVENAFLYDPRVTSFKVTPSVMNGVVTLSGVVNNLKAKKAAEADAKRTVGVWDVKNYIKVRPDNTLTDKEIAANVKTALARDTIVERFDMTVLVRNKKVYLYGEVDSLFEKQRAEDIASGVSGVVAVSNRLRVISLNRIKSDYRIKEEIQDQLFWSYLVDSDDVVVEVENGIATLKGNVDGWVEHDAVIENAFEGGAVAVKDQLQVATHPRKFNPFYYYEGYFSKRHS